MRDRRKRSGAGAGGPDKTLLGKNDCEFWPYPRRAGADTRGLPSAPDPPPSEFCLASEWPPGRCAPRPATITRVNASTPTNPTQGCQTGAPPSMACRSSISMGVKGEWSHATPRCSRFGRWTKPSHLSPGFRSIGIYSVFTPHLMICSLEARRAKMEIPA